MPYVGSATNRPITPSKPRLCAARQAHAIVLTLLGARGQRSRTGPGDDMHTIIVMANNHHNYYVPSYNTTAESRTDSTTPTKSPHTLKAEGCFFIVTFKPYAKHHTFINLLKLESLNKYIPHTRRVPHTNRVPQVPHTCRVPLSAILWMSSAPHMAPVAMYRPRLPPAPSRSPIRTVSSARAVGEPT